MLHDQWLLMNYYHPASQGYESEITNTDYFIAGNGRTSPKAEFDAFIDTMKDYAKDGSHLAILCAFPARITLIKESIPAFKDFARPDCSKFPGYIDAAKVQSVSLLFASGYFESPASYFGHTMLRFNSGNEQFNEFFFDSSLNYGAKVTDSTSSPLYVVRGLFGGYTASYSRNNDFINTNSYTNKQMRDVWEYPLILTPAQRLFLVEHSTELKRARFKYYFLNDNCAHRIARLVEMASGRNMVKTDGSWLLPIQVVQELHNPKDGPSLLKGEIRYPSLKSKVRDQYLALSTEDQYAAAQFLNAPLNEQEPLVSSLSAPALSMVLNQMDVEVAKRSSKAADAEKLAALQAPRRIVLQEKLRRPAAPRDLSDVSTTVSRGALTPATMKHPASVQIGYTARPGDDALTIRYQASNNDLLTRPFEGQEASRFIMGAAEVDFSKDDLDIRRLTFVDIASLNTNPIPMSVTGEFSWALKAEYSARNDICHKCSTVNLDGKVGKALRLNEDLMLYSLIGGQINNKETAYNDILMLTSENGLLFNIDTKTRLNVEANVEVSPQHGNPAYLYKATMVHDLSAQTDLRLSIENDGEHSAAMMRLGVYF